jgi:ankyrin repeat protein
MDAPVDQGFVNFMEGDDPARLIGLLELGADMPNVKNLVLHIAAQLGRVRCVEYMLGLGAEVEVGTAAGLWPIHFAAQSNSGATIRLLIDHGADPTFHPSYDCSPLMTASACGGLEAVRTLLPYYSLPELRAVTKEGCSAVFLAIRGAHVEVLQALLLQGALLPRGDEKVLPRWIYGSQMHKPVLSVMQVGALI